MGIGGEVMDLPLSKPEGFKRWTKPNVWASSFVDPFMSVIQQKGQKQVLEE